MLMGSSRSAPGWGGGIFVRPQQSGCAAQSGQSRRRRWCLVPPGPAGPPHQQSLADLRQSQSNWLTVIAKGDVDEFRATAAVATTWQD